MRSITSADCDFNQSRQKRRGNRAEVTKMDMKVEEGKVAAFRTRVSPLLQIRSLT